jgi:rhodanese-related sulfurtransferase
MNTVRFVVTAAAWLLAGTAFAQDVRLTEDLPYVDIKYGNQTVRIERIQNQDNILTGAFAKTSRPCPPFCIHPMSVAPGVKTVGEMEMIDFMLTDLKDGNGLLIDARTPDWYGKGTIPGSVNIPFTVFTAEKSDPAFQKAVTRCGVVTRQDGSLDFSKAKKLLMFCNGPWCDQSPRAIKGLMRHGYPPEKLVYYRDGIQMWQLLGLTTVKGVE